MANVISSRDGSGLADVVELILDKGIVIDVMAEISLIGINILRITARVVISSVDTYMEYLKYAEAIGRTGAAASPSALMAAGAGASAPRALPAGPSPAYIDVPSAPSPVPASADAEKE